MLLSKNLSPGIGIQKTGKREDSYLSVGLQLAFMPAYHPMLSPLLYTYLRRGGKKDSKLESKVEWTIVTIVKAKSALTVKVAEIEPPDKGDRISQRLWIHWRDRNWKRVEDKPELDGVTCQKYLTSKTSLTVCAASESQYFCLFSWQKALRSSQCSAEEQKKKTKLLLHK